MSKGRLEAFTDGVMAILITIMVLELHSPSSADLASLLALLPQFAMYALSFTILGIYWNNHHHMLHVTQQISGGVLWANLHLLFWLSLVPFATRWMGETGAAPVPTAGYGLVLLLAALSYTILLRAILACQPPRSSLAEAVGRDFKGHLSIALYAASIPLTFVSPYIGLGLIATVALIWLVPDRRIESRLETRGVEGS